MSDVAAVVAAAASSRGIGAGGDLVCVFTVFEKVLRFAFLLFLNIHHCIFKLFKGVAFTR